MMDWRRYRWLRQDHDLAVSEQDCKSCILVLLSRVATRSMTLSTSSWGSLGVILRFIGDLKEPGGSRGPLSSVASGVGAGAIWALSLSVQASKGLDYDDTTGGSSVDTPL
jgi:hypothetical protein